MELRIGFTVVPGNEGWQFPPLQFLKVYKTAQGVGLDSMQQTLQEIMDFAETKLAPFKEVSKDDALIKALQAISDKTPQLENK